MVFLKFFFCFCFMSNKYYLSKLILLKFRCQKISFLCKHNFFIDGEDAQWNLDTELISYFMKCPWNCVSWNFLKEKFQCFLALKVFLLISYFDRRLWNAFNNRLWKLYKRGQILLFYKKGQIFVFYKSRCCKCSPEIKLFIK